jgi:hypothetical protein
MADPRRQRTADADPIPAAGTVVTCAADLPLGAHLVVERRGYRHHGIHVGDGRVIHYAGLSRPWRRGPVEEVSLDCFAHGRPVFVQPSPDARYHGAEVVGRARSRLGEDRYRITTNNCEHFCEWCIHGAARSAQVDHLLDWPPLAALRRLAPLGRRLVPQRAQHAGSCPA